MDFILDSLTPCCPCLALKSNIHAYSSLWNFCLRAKWKMTPSVSSIKGGLVRALSFSFYFYLTCCSSFLDPILFVVSPHSSSVFTTCGLIILTEILTTLPPGWRPLITLSCSHPQSKVIWGSNSHIPPLSGTYFSFHVKPFTLFHSFCLKVKLK